MKIAVISHVHYPIRQPYIGGLEAHTDLLVRQLTALGHTVTLYAKAGSKTNGKVIPIFRGNARFGKNRLLRLSYRYACRHIESHPYDLIINNSLDRYPLQWHTPVMPPMITIFHTPAFWEISDVLKTQTQQQNRTYIAVSELTASQWQSFVSDTINVVSNGIDTTLWQPSTKRPAEKMAFWFGRITPEKGLHIAIEAAQIANIPITVCGKIYDKKYYKETIKPLLSKGGVTYLGHINQQAVNRNLQRASVALVTPMWDEPFGLVAVEALASGVPVAALDYGATASILKDTYGVLSDSDDPKDLAKAITASTDIDRKACADYARATYSVETMVNNYLALLPPAAFSEEPVKWQTYA